MHMSESEYYLDGDYNEFGYDEMISYSNTANVGEVTLGLNRFNPVGLTIFNPIGYIVPSFGIFVLRGIFGSLSAYSTMIFGKLFNLIFYSFVIRKALMTTKAFINSIFVIAFMPMSLYQAASLSYDAVIIPCCILLFAYITKFIYSSEQYRISMGDVIGVCFSCFFIFGAKQLAYVPLILVLLAVPIKRFGTIKRYILCIVSVVIVGVISYIIPTIIINSISNGLIMKSEVAIEHEAFFFKNLNLVFL